MIANGVSVGQSATAPTPYPNSTVPSPGTWEYGSQSANPWGYPYQTYDPRYGPFTRFAPRLGVPVTTYDPRFAVSAIGQRLGFQSVDPRFGFPMPTYDPRFGVPTPGYDPRFGTTMPTYDPRFESPFFGWGFDPSTLMADPRLLNWGAMPVPGLAIDGQPLMPWGGYLGFPARGPEPVLPPPLNPSGIGFGELTRFAGAAASRFGVMGLPKDEEIEDLIHEALDHHPLIPLDADVDVRCESGQVTLTGKVPDKRIKRAAGEAAWWIPGVVDVNNTIGVTGRRQAQATRRRGRQPAQAGR